MRTSLFAAALLCVTSATGAVASDEEAIPVPEEFIISAPVEGLAIAPPAQPQPPVEDADAPPSESQQAVLGTLYTVVAPIFLGTDGNVSYLRLFNVETNTTTVTARVVGYPSATQYGSATIAIPSGAAPQYSITEIMNLAGVSLAPGDNGVSLYLSSPDLAVTYQHVIYSNISQFFENMTLCNDTTISDLQRTNPNVHTTRLNGYPSFIALHNYSANNREYRLFVVESRTGVSQGLVTIQTSPNTSYLIPFSWFEDQIGWNPAAGEVHANLIWDNNTGSSFFYGVTGHLVFNSQFQSYVNLTQHCAIEG